MEVYSNHFVNGVWSQPHKTNLDSSNTLLLVFFDNQYKSTDELSLLKEHFPQSHIVGCSTAGEIIDNEIYDQSIVYKLVKFDHTKLKQAIFAFDNFNNKHQLGKAIADSLYSMELKYILLLCSGATNMDDILKGLSANLNEHVFVSGGLAGDGDRFQSSWLFNNDFFSNSILAVGFYGDNLLVSTSSEGGWEKFGRQHTITRADNNTLYEIDHQKALQMYKNNLGKLSDNLPYSALFYPLAMSAPAEEEYSVRTILGVDEEEQSLTFASEIYNGYKAYFMRTTREGLLNGAKNAAGKIDVQKTGNNTLYLFVNCVGRKLVLGQTTFDEMNVSLDTLPCKHTNNIGFYSYGEISTVEPGKIQLLNQTMTITSIHENS